MLGQKGRETKLWGIGVGALALTGCWETHQKVERCTSMAPYGVVTGRVMVCHLRGEQVDGGKTYEVKLKHACEEGREALQIRAVDDETGEVHGRDEPEGRWWIGQWKDRERLRPIITMDTGAKVRVQMLNEGEGALLEGHLEKCEGERSAGPRDTEGRTREGGNGERTAVEGKHTGWENTGTNKRSREMRQITEGVKVGTVKIKSAEWIKRKGEIIPDGNMRLHMRLEGEEGELPPLGLAVEAVGKHDGWQAVRGITTLEALISALHLKGTSAWMMNDAENRDQLAKTLLGKDVDVRINQRTGDRQRITAFLNTQDPDRKGYQWSWEGMQEAVRQYHQRDQPHSVGTIGEMREAVTAGGGVWSVSWINAEAREKAEDEMRKTGRSTAREWLSKNREKACARMAGEALGRLEDHERRGKLGDVLGASPKLCRALREQGKLMAASKVQNTIKGVAAGP